MRIDKAVIEDWIRQIQENGRGVTKWEQDFVDSVEEQFAERQSLSEKQLDILERIYADRT